MIELMPPNDQKAEESVLGSCLIDHDAIRHTSAIIKPADFYIVKNQWVYGAMLALHSKRQPVDFVLLTSELDARGQLAEIGGPAYISQLINSTPTAIHAEGYARIVADMATRRGLLRAASDIVQKAYDLDGEITAQLSGAYSALRSVSTYNAQDVSIKTVCDEVFDELTYWAEHPIGLDEVRGARTYIRAIDRMIGGMEQDDFTILAARPGVGKSCLSGIVGFEKAKHGERVAIFSLEMKQKRLVRRLASRIARVPYDKARRGQCDADELNALMRATGDIESLPLHIFDQSSVTTAYIDSKVASLMPLDFVIIDNINIIGDPKEKGENRATQVGRISANLHRIARDYNVPVWCICHMNRDIERRSDGVPTLADLKESGDIEQNADNVIFMYTAKDDVKIGADGQVDDKEGCVVTLLPAKLRDGNTDSNAKLFFNKPIQDFAPTTTREVRL